MSIGIDLDEVIADTISGILLFHNEKYGTRFTKRDFLSYRFWEIWGGTREEAIKKMYDFFETDRFADVVPIPGSLEAIAALKKEGHKIFLITGRQNHIIEKTEQWIKKYFPDVFDGLYFANSYNLTSKGRKKSEICAELGIKIMIEDDIDHAMDCAGKGILVLLFDQPWNQRELPPNVERVFSWEDILKNHNLLS
jgi:uncharacterized HAD superfamily protein